MNNLKKGFIPVMLTPFKNNGLVDYQALSGLTAYYIESGATGLFANCLSSEMFELDEDERLKVIETVLKAAAQSVPVVATGTFGQSIPQQADFVKKVYSLGVKAVIGITSLIADENDADNIFEENVMQLFDLTENIPMGFYECPVPYKRIVSPEQLKMFVSTGRLTYHKDTCLDLSMIKRKIEATRQHTFGLYDAYMGHAVASLQAGAAGLSCIQGNFFPEFIVWLCDNYNNQSMARELDLAQQFLISNMEVMHKVYPVIAKYYLQQRGIDIEIYTRRNNHGILHDDVKTALQKLSNDYDALKGQLELKVPSVSIKHCLPTTY